MKRLRARLSAFAYAVTIGFARAVLFSLARWEVHGRERIPAEGPLILVANHVHLLDPPLVGASATRRTRPMAKRELFETPLIGWYFWAYGAFPVRRFSGDMGALRVARNYLRDGEVVLMFPEGTRSRDEVLHAALPGAGMVALLAQAPVVPVAITGSNVRVPGVFFAWLRRARPRITVTFGEPFGLHDLVTDVVGTSPTRRASDARAAEAATDRMMRAVAALLPPEMRGAYSNDSDGTVVVARPPREERRTDDGDRTDSDANDDE